MASLLLHWKSNNVCPFPQKLLISHWLPVLSGSNPEMAHPGIHPGSTGTPNPQEKNNKKKRPSQPPPPPPPPKKRKKDKREKKEGAIFANPPSEDSLVDEPL